MIDFIRGLWDDDVTRIFLIVEGVVLFFFMVSLYLRAKERAKKRKEEEAFTKAHPHLEAEKFYELCTKNGIADVSTAEGRARLNLCIKNNNLNMTEDAAIESYLLGKSETERLKREKKESEQAAELKKLNEQEQQFEEATKRYISCYGQEKAVKMCLDEAAIYRSIMDNCDREYAAIMNAANMAYRSGKQPEQSWALHGGIASGIAGGAAGLATAMDVQKRNEGIRAANQELLHSVTFLSADATTKINRKKAEAEESATLWEKRAEKAKNYLVQDYPSNDLLARLNPELIKQERSNTGAIRVNIKLHSTPNLRIFENVPAVVDGCIKAALWDGEKKVGEAYFALPYCGATKDCELSSICRGSDLKRRQNYIVTFEAEHLWAIETPEAIYDPITDEEKLRKKNMQKSKH